MLDAFVAAGGNFIDTADAYAAWIPGGTGGESETIIGEWMDERGNRDEIVIATKVGKKPDRKGLAPETIQAAVEECLQRLQTDRIDLLYAHADDPDTPLDESLGAFDAFVRAGYVRYLGASNHSAERLAEALAVSDHEGLTRYAPEKKAPVIRAAMGQIGERIAEGSAESVMRDPTVRRVYLGDHGRA